MLALRLTDVKGKEGSAFSFHAHRQHRLVSRHFTSGSLVSKSDPATATAGGACDHLC